MEAAIEKILSENIDVSPEEVPDFREGESGSDEESESDLETSEEEGSGGEEQSEDEEDDASGDDEDEEQDALDADLAPESESEEDGSDAEDEDDTRKQPSGPQAGFLEGGKDATFARAFARIIDSSAAKSDVLGAPILAGSKSIAARKAEEEAEAKADKAAKKLRLEMKQRGHVVPKRRGVDPLSDQREKSLQKTATRGVVQLFNAVAKAQRRLREEEGVTGSRAKAAKLGKASFLAELKNSKSGAGGNEAVVPSARAPNAAAAAMGPSGGGDSDEEGGAGWAVLQEGFTGLQGSSKMKDWDKQMSDDESEGPPSGAGSDDDDSE